MPIWSRTLILTCALVCTLAAVEDSAIPDHESHTVGWQEVIVFVQAKDDYVHGQAIPEDVMAGRLAAADILNEYFKNFSYGRTGLRFTIFPYFVENTSGEWEIEKDAKTIDPGIDVSGYDRIWNDSWQGGAGRAFVGGKKLRTGLGDHYPARHELAHTYGVVHPENVRIGDNEGANTKIRWDWIHEDDPDGFAYTRVTGAGTYRIYDYGDPDREPQGVPGESIALVVETGDGALAINNNGKDRWSVFLDDARLDLNGEAEKTGYLGLSKSEDVSTYRYTDQDGWSVDITLEAVIPAADGKPLAGDIRIDFPAGPKPSIEITSPENVTPVALGETLDIEVVAIGVDQVRYEYRPLGSEEGVEFARREEGPYTVQFTAEAVGYVYLTVRGMVEQDGELQQVASDSILIRILEPSETVDRAVALTVVPMPVDMVPVHLSTPTVAPSEASEVFTFEGLIAEQPNRFGFAPSGGG